MNRLLALLELDFVLPGRVRDLTQLLATHVSRHLRSNVHGMKLLQALSSETAAQGASFALVLRCVDVVRVPCRQR